MKIVKKGNVLKRVILILEAFILLSFSVLMVCAEGDTELCKPVSAYAYGNELYTYFYISEEVGLGTFSACLLEENGETEQKADFIPLRDSNKPVSYLFLIDLSAPTAEYKGMVRSAISSMSLYGNEHTTYAIATNGNSFQVIAEDINDQSSLLNEIDFLTFGAGNGDLNASIMKAYDYLGNKERKSGELVILVVIAGDIPELSSADITVGQDAPADDSGPSEADTPGVLTLNVSPEDVNQRIAESPEILTSIVCCGKGEELNSRYSTARGIKVKIDSSADMKAVSEPWEKFWNGLYFSAIPEYKSNLLERTEATIQVSKKSMDGTSEVLTEAKIQNITSISASASDESSAIAEKPNTDSEEDSFFSHGILGGLKNKIPVFLLVIFNVILFAVIAILVFIILLLAIRFIIKAVKTGNEKATIKKIITKGTGIPVSFDIITGVNAGLEAVIHVDREITIGRSRNCDIYLSDPAVSEFHASIVMEDGAFYIKDTNSSTGTYLEGMRIQEQNIIRSGDVISVGNTEFTLRF